MQKFKQMLDEFWTMIKEWFNKLRGKEKAEANPVVDGIEHLRDLFEKVMNAATKRVADAKTKGNIKTVENNAEDGGISYSLEALGYENKQFDFGVDQSDINHYIENAYLNENEKSYIKFLNVRKELVNEVLSDVDITG